MSLPLINYQKGETIALVLCKQGIETVVIVTRRRILLCLYVGNEPTYRGFSPIIINFLKKFLIRFTLRPQGTGKEWIFQVYKKDAILKKQGKESVLILITSTGIISFSM